VQARGYSLKDVALLCRSNKEGRKLAAHLVDRNIPVVSSESIRLVSSPKVRLIIALLRLLVNYRDLLARTETIRLLYQLGLLQGNLHSYLQKVKTSEPKKDDTTESFFYLLQNQGIDINPGRLRIRPLYDLCEELIRILEFDRKTDPFIQFFLDLVLEQTKGYGSSLVPFLEYWDLKKSGLSIIVPEDLNAVRIMTIHKAKGLEFPVVVYPYVHETLQKTHKKMWIDLDEYTAADLNAALVNTNQNLEDTSFGERVIREQEKSLLDMVNLLYVVFTRPTDCLYILCDQPKASHHPPNSIPSLMVGYLKEIGIWQEELLDYAFGSSPDRSVRRKEGEPESTPVSFISNSWRDRVLISYQAPVNWDVEEPERKQEWGNLIHRILSQVFTPPDLEPVLEEFLYQGTIVEKEYNTLLDLIREFLDRPEVSCYFEEGLNVLTESEIITHSGKVQRPDRIVLRRKETLIIDFKTGSPSEHHKSQMQKYLEVVRNMSYPGVRGVILYLNPTAPVEVV
jgi:ATP-dependent exoDNAse (exonuclease V) beta subunit